jgi:hypothetical protein
MIFNFVKYLVRKVAVLMALIIVTSLFWCGDDDCSFVATNDQCATVLCSVPAGQDAPSRQHSDDAHQECTCICHVPTTVVISSVFASQLIPQVVSFEFPEPSLLSSTRSIYHPPKA